MNYEKITEMNHNMDWSKVHIVLENGKVALCGKNFYGSKFDGAASNAGDCKRCNKIAGKLEIQAS